jgi:hypothetical protein
MAAVLPYSSSALQRLAERTDYEAWFLEAVYKIAEDDLFPTFPDAVIYPANSVAPKFIAYMRGNIILGDWRAGFLNAGAPLVFVTAFKLLDMIMEWVLEENGFTPSFRFQQKLSQFTSAIRFPAVIESKPWLRERLIGLDRTVEPLRGTIIHNRHFASSDGTIHVSSSKGNVIGPSVEITSGDLRKLALAIVSVLRYVDTAWSLNEHREKLLRHEFDNLVHLHGCAAMGQKRPFSPTVRVYCSQAGLPTIDIRAIQNDLATRYANDDCMFDLRILVVEGDAVTDAFLLPWSTIQTGVPLERLEPYRVSIPDDVNVEHYRPSAG